MRVVIYKNDVIIGSMDIAFDNMLFTKHDSVVFQTEKGHSFSVDAYKGETINSVQTYSHKAGGVVEIRILDREETGDKT